MLNQAGITLFFIVLSFALCSCSVHQPAPVTTAGLYSQSNKGRLQGRYYTVKQGDTLYSIAWLANLDPKHLAAINAIQVEDLIFPGQKLTLTVTKQKQSAATSQKITKGKTQVNKQKPQNVNENQKNNQKASESVSKVAKNGSLNAKPVKKSNKKLEQKKNKAYSGNSKQEKAEKNSPYKNVTKWLMPTSGKIVSRFSSAENGNKGIDITGRRGQAILAAADGKVVYAGSALRGYGKLIIVKHNDDYLSAYAHNHKFHVQEQDVVKAGQRIADMGDTDAPLDMLHFEIRYRGKSVNPELYLPR